MTRLVDRPIGWIAVLFAGWVAAILSAVSPELWQSPFLLVQDDARHFTVWLRQLGDPSLFQDDAVAAYNVGRAPAFYVALYVPSAMLGIDVVTWHFLVITPLACLFFTVATFRFMSLLLPTVRAAGLATLLLSGIVAATTFGLWDSTPIYGHPRNFGLGIVFLALIGFMEHRNLLLAVVMFAGANMYPIASAVAGCTMAALMVEGRKPYLSVDGRTWLALSVAAVAGLGGLALYLYSADTAAPTMSLEQARTLPIFWNGRAGFFRENPLSQFLCSGRGGLLPVCVMGSTAAGAILSLAGTVAAIAAGIASHRWILSSGQADADWRQRARLFQRLTLALVFSGLVLFAISYPLAFQAHFPARYAQHSIGVAYQTGIVFVVMAAAYRLWRALPLRTIPHPVLVAALCALWFAVIIHARTVIVRDQEPKISAYLRSTPVDSRVAGFSAQLDSVPAFANRTVFFALELLLPYRREFYELMASRVQALTDVYAAPLGEKTATFIERHSIDYFLVERGGVGSVDVWARSFPNVAALEHANVFVSNAGRIKPCIVTQGTSHDLIDAACLVELIR